MARARGEHAFRVVKQLWGFAKVRYRGNTRARLCVARLNCLWKELNAQKLGRRASCERLEGSESRLEQRRCEAFVVSFANGGYEQYVEVFRAMRRIATLVVVHGVANRATESKIEPLETAIQGSPEPTDDRVRR